MQRTLLVLAAVGSAASDDISLLQTSSHLKNKESSQPLCAPVRKYMRGNYVYLEICGSMATPNPPSFIPKGQQAIDLDRPLRDVQREHPGNLYSYFPEMTRWISPGIARADGSGYYGYKGAPMPAFMQAKNGGPEIIFTFDGLQITTHQDTCQAADDPYCYSLGWMKGQALDKQVNMGKLMDDAAAWNDLGAAECARMKEEFGFDDDEITLGAHIRETNDMYVKAERTCNWHEPSPGPKATVRDFKKHAYAKCFMNNVTTEMGYCYFRGCILGGESVIGHGDNACNY